jgi:CheY-like chemotaxis protein/anti-sigma regulatory factor (Ser/Thr protein kinase)
MSKILIVDDSPVDRLLAGRLLEKPADPNDPVDFPALTALYAANGAEALAVLKKERPDAVLTDLQMPDVDGLALVQEIRVKYPLTPVILMTAHGSEDVAVKALHLGAASYVPKHDLSRDLRETVAAVLEAAQAKRGHRRLMGSLTRSEAEFVLENDPALIPPLVGHLKETLSEVTDLDDTAVLRVSVALREAVLNAMEHGNLELNSALRENDGVAYHKLADQRRHQKPYRDRRVTIHVRQTPKEAVYLIRDEGPGFDPANLPDPLDPANLERASGRGLLLIRTFMTEVRHNERGNEITLVLRT